MKIIAIGLIVGMLACASHLAAQAPSQAPAQSKASATPKTGAASATTANRKYDPRLLRPSLLKEKAPDTYQVKFATTKGDFIVTITRAWAPFGADRFYNLVKHHFYDNASFFRALPGFVVQWGISAYPPVAAAWEVANIQDDPVSQSNKRGYLTFAQTNDPNTRNTQVFINLADNSRLDGMRFAPFAQVTDGMNVVENLYTGYGEGPPTGAGPDQDQITKQGKGYLDKGWPKLDSIKTATFVGIPAAPSKPKTVAKPAPPATMKQ